MQANGKQALLAPFSEATKGLPTLGDLVWWHVPATIEVALPDLEARLKTENLPKELVPRVTPRGALSTALRALETDNLIRRVVEDGEKIVFALVAEEIDAGRLAVQFQQTETITYKKVTRTLDFTNGQNAEKIRELFDRYRSTVTATHLRTLVRNALDETDPVGVRAGLLFVPRRGRSRLEAVGSFVAKLAADASVGRLGVVDSAETRATMLKVVREEIEGEIEAAKCEIDALLAEDGVRSSTLTQRLESFRHVKSKAEGYATLLQFSAQDLVRRVGELEDRVKQAL